MRRAIQDEQDRPATPNAPELGETALSRTWRGIRPRRRSIVISVALTAFVLGAAYLASKPGTHAPAANRTDAGANFAEIERFVQDEMSAQRIPGLALGIVESDRIAYVRGFGTVDDSGREVTPETPFIIGSVSKSLTGTTTTSGARSTPFNVPTRTGTPPRSRTRPGRI